VLYTSFDSNTLRSSAFLREVDDKPRISLENDESTIMIMIPCDRLKGRKNYLLKFNANINCNRNRYFVNKDMISKKTKTISRSGAITSGVIKQ